MCMKHPEEGFVSFYFGLQFDTKRTSCPRLVNRTSFVSFLRIDADCDATWRPTEVYIDFGRPARR